jgi:hypothetical protein
MTAKVVYAKAKTGDSWMNRLDEVFSIQRIQDFVLREPTAPPHRHAVV